MMAEAESGRISVSSPALMTLTVLSAMDDVCAEVHAACCTIGCDAGCSQREMTYSCSVMATINSPMHSVPPLDDAAVAFAPLCALFAFCIVRV